MKKSKIISLFLALLMLTTCVLGALFIGADAVVQTPTVIYTVADYEEEGKEHFTGFSEALQKAASLTWGKDDVLEIRFKGEQVSAGPQGTFDENGNINSTGIQGLLFGQETIWREDGTKLPITIRGINMKSARDSWIYIDAAGGWYTCANDYTFVNLTLPIGDYGTQFFAGSGNITFHECNLYFSSGRLVIHNMDEWYEKTAISTELSEYVAKTYDVDILPINNAANLATQSAAFGDKELGHLLFAASKYEGVDFGDWSHEGDVGGGQYLYACVLFETLTRQSCIGNTFRPSYKLKYSDMTWEELQQIAHKAVEEQYGKGYCNGQMPADIGGDDIFNFLLVGSSNAYYCIDELASIARAAGVNMKVHHAYYSSIPIKKILNQEGYSMQVWYDADGKGAVKSSEMNSFTNLSTILPAKDWDAVGTFETSGELDDHGLDSANHQTQFNKVLSECSDIEKIYALFRKECDPNTRMLWYETGTEPVGAFGSSSISSTALKGYIFGDNCSDAAFIGWEGKVKDGEKIKTGVTFGDNVLYVDNTATKSVVRVAASGYLMGQNAEEITDEEAENMTYHASGAEGVADIRPIQVEPSLTIDGSGTNIFNISVKLGRAPSDATIYLKKGSVNMIYGDNCSVQSGDTEGQEEYFYGDMNVVITGGSLRAVNMLYDSYLTGDLNLTVNPVDGSIGIEKYLRGLFGGGKIVGGCTGDVTFDVQGITLADGLHGGGGSGKVTNILKDVTFTNSSAATVVAVRCGSPSSIENYLENVVIPSTGSSYMGAYENEVGGNIKNTFKNCTIAGNLFCGNLTGNIKGNIENNFIGGTYGSLIYDDTGKKTGTCNTYGGTEKTGYTVAGSITNKIKGAAFQGDWFYGGNSAASFAENSNLTYRIINEIDGASFIRYAGGSASSTTDKIIKNTISGDQTKFTTGFYCGSNSSPVNETENYFKAKMTGYPSGGSNGGKANRVVNYIEDGADLEGFYAAANGGSATLVQNFIRGGKVGEFIGGSRTGTMSGSVENTVTGGKITKFYGGGNSSTVTSATTTISGGEFYESISKGGKTGTVTTASLEFKLGANPIGFYGTFTLENLSGSGVIQVGKDASVTVNSAEAGNVTVEQTEYWQNQTYFTDNSGNLTLSVRDNVPGEASVLGNTVVGTAPANPVTTPVSAKLVLDTKVGVKFYFNKAEITEGFTYSVVLGGKEIASGAYADLTEEGEYLVLSFGGIGLSDFMTEFEIVSECIFDTNKAKYNTIVKLAELGAENTEVYKEKQLFWSIADLGRVAKDPDGAIHNQFLYDVTSKATGKGGEEGALLTFTGKNLYMNDSVGIRLYGKAASLEDIKNMKVIVEGDNVTRLCSISEGVLKNGAYEFTVDIFFSVLKMHDTIEIEIVDKNGKKCLTLSDQVDWIAKTILTKEPENNLAKQVLIYIQKVDRFVNEYDSGIITPPEMGGETELGGKVEL